MRSKHIPIFPLLIFALVFVLDASAARAEFDLVRESGPSLEIVWRAERPSGGVAGETEAMFPSVNRPTTWIALPPGGTLGQIQILDARWEPRPDLALPEDPRLPGAWEGPLVSAGLPTYVRHQFGVPVSVSPWRVGVNGQLEALASVRVAFDIQGQVDDRSAALSRTRAGSGRDAFEPLYEGVFLNYESGKAWRRLETESAPRRRGGDYFSSTSAPWVRMTVQSEGLYAVTGTDLERTGIDLSSISDPATVRVFTGTQLAIADDEFVADAPSWMEEVAIATEGLEDGVFDPSDRLIFLGHGPDDWFSNKGVERPGIEDFYRDPSANESTYWLTWGGAFSGDPVRMATVDGTGAESPFVRTVRDRIHLEGNEIIDARQRENPGEGAAAWEIFWWRELVTTEVRDESQNVTVRIPDPVATDPVEVLARVWGANDPDSDEMPPPPDHDLELVLNGESLVRAEWEGRRRQDLQSSGTQLVPGDEQVFQLVGRARQDNTISRLDIVYLAFIEMTYSRQLLARDGRLATFVGGVVGPQSFEVANFTDTADVWVVDALDPRRPTRISADATDGSTVQFRFNVPRDVPARLVAAQSDAFLSPTLSVNSEPTGGYLRERTDAVQMIILTHEDFLSEAEDLAEYRRLNFPDRETASVAVVDVRQVYDEFAFGRKDPNAIRNFFEHARDHWTGGNPEDGPAYALLFGDAHRDQRGLVVTDSPDFVPTYIRYFENIFVRTIYDPRFSSDDYLVLLDGPGEVGMDLFLGRLVARTPAEARTMVEKTIRYEQQSDTGPWRNQITLVADDVCQGTVADPLRFLHMRQTEQLEPFFPSSMDLKKNYLYEYGAECIFTNKPASAADLLASMNDGTLVVNYTGHGGETQVSDERVFEVSNVGSLDNLDRMFLFLTASCSIGKYDTSGEGLGEALIRYEQGGSPVVFSASAVAFAQGNSEVNKLFFDRCFPEGCGSCSRPMGEASALAKLLLNNSGLNQRRYILHGDPCVALISPGHEMEVELSTADGEPLGTILPRGTQVRVTGSVLDAQGGVLEDFDGSAWVEVFDSEISRKPTPGSIRDDYQLPGATIYRGEARVDAGRFAMTFFTPAALRTGDRGVARLFVYAEDGTRDASGSVPELSIPESVPPPSDDVDGPELVLRFVEGRTTVGPEAVFIASLEDESGINVTGLVPSRSVVFRLEQEGQTIFAEDISGSVAFGNDFRQASLEHVLPANLPEGRYQLVLEASDNVNNRSGVQIDFVLSGSGELGLDLSRVFNLPNPMEDSTRFYASIGEASEVEIQIFSLRGRKIRTLEGGFLTPGQLADEGVPWDGRDEDGDRLANGVYFYKVEATSSSGASQSTIGRLVVSR